jgi:hypothetical protein
MSSANGYGKIITSGSIFAYDTGDFRNSYKGKPGYNVLGIPYPWVGNNDGTYFKTTTGNTTVNIPAIGDREVYFVDIWNDYPNSGNCCPSLWRYGDWGITTGVTGNTLYTYSIIYKCESGYTHPNFMYHYEYNGGTYLTEFGVFDNAKRLDLGDGWYLAYNTFTTNASCNTIYTGMWYYQYGVYDTVYLYKASLTTGNQIFPAEQFIPPSTTRSDTQALYPVIGNQSLNLSGVSFDTNAQMTFDGTNDRFTTGLGNIGNNVSFAAVINSAGSANTYNMYMGQLLPYMGALGGNQIVFSDWINSTQQTISTSGGTIVTGQNHYVVCTREYNGTNTINKIYIDGKLSNSGTFSGAPTYYGDTIHIGDGQTSTWYPFYGKINTVQIYNRTLTSGEIEQNYRHYKTRFNLS